MGLFNAKPLRGKGTFRVRSGQALNYASLIYLTAFFLLWIQLPAGFLHYYFGEAVYAKDALAVIFVPILLSWILVNRAAVRGFGVATVFLICNILVYIPLLLSYYNRTNGLLMEKWVILWTIAFIGGFSSQHVRVLMVRLASVMLLVYFVSDMLIGLWEIKHQTYFINISGAETTLAGTAVVRVVRLVDIIRVRGLQRTVFQFSNAMAVFCVISAWWALYRKNAFEKLLAVALAIVAGYCVVRSGGRSGLLGCILGLGALVYVCNKDNTQQLIRSAYVVIGMCLSLALLVTIISPAKIVTGVFSIFNYTGAISDAESSIIRGEVWGDVIQTWISSPMRLFFGNILVEAIHGGGGLRICDNQYIWFLFHFGVFGTGIYIALFLRMFIGAIGSSSGRENFAALLIAIVALGMGDGIGRDSLFLFSSLLMFWLTGLLLQKNIIWKIQMGRSSVLSMHR